MKYILYPSLFLFILCCCKSKEQHSEQISTSALYKEHHRPQLHFSPQEKWMNDPNGMVYYKGEYHLFYQYYPDADVWGPMHWGHAISTDLIHWKHLPIALYPDTLGYIFSGSAVVDEHNTSGLGTEGNPPMVAIFTYHDAEKEKAGRIDYQYQGIAYSTDSGRNWKKYEHNPVLKNQGIKDFRDPKVFWHEETKKWIMILAVKDHVELWNSPDLKSWNKLSDFGFDYGAHGGVWECPDLFQVNVEGDSAKKWVMIVSINPGGPNGGSATQYFTGDFDGKIFKPDQDKKITTWLDYGPDDYAGVTWSNAPDNRKIFLGWMSNWKYAQEVPTKPWRSAMTVPRILSLIKVNDALVLKSKVLPALEETANATANIGSSVISDSLNITKQINFPISSSLIRGTIEAKDFCLQFSNSKFEKLKVGYDAKNNLFYIDRKMPGENTFTKNFNGNFIAPRISKNNTITFTIVVDVSSIEIFFDEGITLMASLYFPDTNLDTLNVISTSEPVKLNSLTVKELSSIWQMKTNALSQ